MNPSALAPKPPERAGPSAESVHKTLTVAKAALSGGALMYAVVYLLLIVNRTKLLHPVLAGAATWLARLAGLAAIAAVTYCAVLLTRWLIARRSVAFAHRHLPESRPRWALWAGCLVPLANLAWAPVYVIELAGREGQLARLRKPIVVWWLLWVIGTVVSLLAVATSWAQDAQGIANNVATMILAYLLGLATVIAAEKIVEGFEHRPVRRPAHRWVVITDDRIDSLENRETEKTATPAAVLESERREPAA